MVFTILICLCIAVLLKSLHDFIFPKLSLPPGSKTVHFVGRLLWLLKSSSNLEPILRNLHAKYGPIVTLQIGSRTAIFISDISIAYKALVQNGVVFADRPQAVPINRLLTSNYKYCITSVVMARHGASSAAISPRDPPSFTGQKLLSDTKVGFRDFDLSTPSRLRIR